MHFISEELARVRRAELMEEACDQRLAAAVARVSRAARDRRRAKRRGIAEPSTAC